MNEQEIGFISLTSHLGDPERRPLTTAEVARVLEALRREPEHRSMGELTEELLLHMGIPARTAARIPTLLEDRAQTLAYIASAARLGITPVTRRSRDYPRALANRMGLDAPCVLWIRGEQSFLQDQAVSLVGNRDIDDAARDFAYTVGALTGIHHLVLVSGDARGTDQAGQEAALVAEGKVISVLPDTYRHHDQPRPNQLQLWEDSFDLEFRAASALSRNHVIHALGDKVIVGRITEPSGGTFDGTAQNLRHNRTPVFVWEQNTPGCRALLAMGAYPVREEELETVITTSWAVEPLI